MVNNNKPNNNWLGLVFLGIILTLGFCSCAAQEPTPQVNPQPIPPDLHTNYYYDGLHQENKETCEASRRIKTDTFFNYKCILQESDNLPYTWHYDAIYFTWYWQVPSDDNYINNWEAPRALLLTLIPNKKKHPFPGDMIVEQWFSIEEIPIKFDNYRKALRITDSSGRTFGLTMQIDEYPWGNFILTTDNNRHKFYYLATKPK